MYSTRKDRAVPAVVLGLVCAVLLGCGARSPEALYNQAVIKAKSGDIAGSMIDLKNALQKRENYGPARRLLGEHYLRMGDPLSAINELTRAQHLGQPTATVLPLLFRAQLDAGKGPEALKLMTKLSEPQMTAQLWALRAEALTEIGDARGAAAALGNSLAQEPKNVDAHLGAARLAWASADVVTAKREFAQSVQLDPHNTRGWLLKGEFELANNQIQSAAASFNSALGVALGVDRNRARLGLARCFLAGRDVDRADQQVQAVLKALPNLPMAQYLAAYIEFLRHDWDKAEDHLLEVLKSAPDHPQSLMLKGAVNAEQKKYLQAEAALNRVIALTPDDVKPRKLLANIYLRQGETAKAVAVLEIAPSKSPTDVEYQSLLGGALLRDGQAGKAVVAMQKAANLAPETAEVRSQLAVSKLAAGDAEGAVADLRALIEAKLGGERPQQLLILVLLKQQKFDDVLAQTELMIKRHPSDPSGYNFAAAAWLGKHDMARAEQALSVALRLDPKFVAAKVNLARIAIARKDFVTAARLLTLARAENPQAPEPVLGLAAMEFERNNDKAAIALLESARSKWPSAIEPRLTLAQVYLNRRDFVAAEGPAREATALQPNSVAAASLYSKALLGQNKIRPALAVLERIAPRSGTDADLQFELAWARAAVGDKRGGSEAAQRAVSYSDRKSVPALLLAARLAVEQERLDDARANIAQARVARGKNATKESDAALAVLDGDVARLQKQWPTALQHYSHAYSLTPTGDTLGRVALALMGSGRNDEAITKLTAWLQQHPKDEGARFRLADAQMNGGQSAAAKKSYESLVTTAPDNAVVQNNLAWLYLNDNDVRRGLASAEQAYALARDNPDVMDTVAWLRFKSGKKSDDVRELLQNAAAQTKNPEVRYHLAEVLAAQGKVVQARTELDAILQPTATFASRSAAQALREKL